ncbi:hypothetical protein KCU88_g3156, partial [Aureobasidium melanogenum]
MTTHIPAAGQSSSPVDSAEAKEKDKDNKGVSSRRLKKREIDRRCQRQARERTKSRIAYLEGLVEDFRRQDSSGQVATLMKQLQDVETERDLMAKTLKDIQKAMDIHKPTSASEDQTHGANTTKSQTPLEDLNVERKRSITSLSDDVPIRLKSEAVEIPSEISATRSFELVHYSPPPNHPLPAPEKLFAPEVVRLDSTNNPQSIPKAVVQSKAAIHPNLTPLRYQDNWAAPRHTCSCHSCYDGSRPSGRRPVFQGNYWKFANEVLSERFDWSNVQAAPPEIEEDVPIRALIEGWDAVARRGPLHPTWQLLRQIDQTLFGTCPKTERLAIMRAMHLLLQFHTESTAERYERLPPWYMRRPSQNLAHSYAIDYFAWPGLRERFIFNEHDYCGNDFWYLFCKSLRIQWPYEFRDCYTRETSTGLYKMSPIFEQRLVDIRCWTMGPDIFRRFPEFSSDIPSVDMVPPLLSPSTSPAPRKRIRLSASPKVVQTERTYEKEKVITIEDDEPVEQSSSATNPRSDSTVSVHVQGYQYSHSIQPQSHQCHRPPGAPGLPIRRQHNMQGHAVPRPQEMHVPGSHQHHMPHNQGMFRPHDPTQHMYNISDFNPMMVLDTYAYGANIGEADFANVYQPEAVESYPNAIY